MRIGFDGIGLRQYDAGSVAAIRMSSACSSLD